MENSLENSVIHYYSGLWSSPWPKAVAAFNEKSTTIQKKIEKLTTQADIISTSNPKQPFINGCFNWMIPNLYIYRKWLFHQTSIYKWLFGVPGMGLHKP